MLTVAVTPDLANGLIIVALRGVLALDSAPTVRGALLKCLADGPDAVLVDVSDLRVDKRSSLTVFPAALRTSGTGAVMLLFGASPDLVDLAQGGVLGPIGMYETLDQALTAAATRPPRPTTRRQRMTFPGGPTAASRARGVVAGACRAWGVEHLGEPATQVVSELVTNAVQHAGHGDVHLAVALRGDYLYVSVRDHSTWPPLPEGHGDPPPPRSERGRGLFLVDVYATSWGITPAVGGKTVWAALRATPVTAPAESPRR